MDKLQFETNIPVTVALKYGTGKRVDSRYHDYEVFYSTTTQPFYATPLLDEKIVALAPRVGEPFSICKREVKEGQRKRTEWQVARVDDQPEQRIPQPAAPAAIKQPSGSPDSRNSSQDNAGRPSMGAIMRAALKASIDELLAAQQYAAEKGMHLEFNEEDVRTAANSMFIQYCKGSL